VITLGALAAHGSFPPTAESIATARRLVRTTLAGWGIGDVAGDALLIASELCTNAVIHAGTSFTVSCTHLGGAIRVAVRDGYPGRALPTAVVAPGEQKTSGRGLLLCAALSSSWGVDYDQTGKLVWCQLDLPGAPPGAGTPGDGTHPVGPLAAVTLDPEGRIRDWTTPATELLGWAAAEVAGRPLTDLATDRRQIDGGETRTDWLGATDLLVLDSQGNRVPVQARFVPVGSAQPSMVLLAPAGDTWAFVLASQANEDNADHGRDSDALAAFDSDRVPAHELPQRAAEACCDYLGGDAAYLMLVDENGELRVAGATGLGDRAQGYTEPTEDVLRSSPDRNPQVVAELADSPNAPQPLVTAGMHAAVSVPILVDGRLIGQLTVAAAAPGRFGPEDAVRLHLAAGQLGRPLDRARITDVERRRRGWLSYLAEASDLLSGTLQPQATVAVLAQLLVPRLATWCGVRMTDERGRSKLAYVWHAAEPMLDTLRVLLEGAADPVATGEPAGMREGAKLAGDTPEVAAMPAAEVQQIRSGPVASVALTARGRTLGIVLIGREPGERFGRDTLGLAEEICRRAALILDNALLYSDNLATSRALQASLLPAQMPHVRQLEVGVAYQAKGEGHDVGGDFYDLYATEPDCWRFTIGDVCGSGPAAAAITGLARNALRILGRQGLPLPEVLSELNSLILGESVGSRFLTALHGEIRPAEGGGVHLRLVAAGHPTPYLVDAERPPEPVTKPQPLLGVLPAVTYHEQELTLAPGQMLVCLTDGVLERRDGERMLGERDLAAVLGRTAGVSAATAAAQVQQAVLEYSAEPAKDDFAILVLRAL
jgi:serine phosphatase RsbU (regulator of sigma subunit)/anti-sigma regulatory factor (Ser/Thr protein kinase)